VSWFWGACTAKRWPWAGPVLLGGNRPQLMSVTRKGQPGALFWSWQPVLYPRYVPLVGVGSDGWPNGLHDLLGQAGLIRICAQERGKIAAEAH
jgi:hypothetical protein